VSDRPRVPAADLAVVERPTGHREPLIPPIVWGVDAELDRR
jgi:hypothetical protein